MIRVRRYHEDGRVDEEIDPAEVSECLGTRGALLWVDVEHPSVEDVKCLAEEFDVHHLAAEDLLEPSPRPRLGRFGEHFLVVAHDTRLQAGRLATSEVDLVFGDGWVISVRKADSEGGSPPMPVEPIMERFEQQRGEEGATDEGFLLYVFLEAITEGFFETAEALEDRLEAIEAVIFTRGPAPADLRGAAAGGITEQLYHLRRDLVGFRRVAAPLRETLTPILRGEIRFVGDAALVHLRDVYDLTVRATDMVDAQRDLLNGALEAHLSIMSNRMNLVMKQATSWGAILVVATLVSGIYGMNFDNFPWNGKREGFFFALALIGVCTAVLYRLFKQRGWL
ncbi:MAG: magnesium transporter CorA family protein [Actinomycetota bacterium]|nr:magnesium transporter CorA family protein [Actinomycetota bacterium]